MAITIKQLLMERDGLVDTEAEEISEDVRAKVITGMSLQDALADHGIDWRELGLPTVNYEL